MVLDVTGSSPVARPILCRTSCSTLAALILAGGGASRMGGGDKPLLVLAGQREIERSLLPSICRASRSAPTAIPCDFRAEPAGAGRREVRGRGRSQAYWPAWNGPLPGCGRTPDRPWRYAIHPTGIGRGARSRACMRGDRRPAAPPGRALARASRAALRRAFRRRAGAMSCTSPAESACVGLTFPWRNGPVPQRQHAGRPGGGAGNRRGEDRIKPSRLPAW